MHNLFSWFPSGNSTVIFKPSLYLTSALLSRPSSLNDVVKSFITLTNPQFGEIHYEVSGVGLLPGIMPTVLIDAPLGEIGSQTVEFYNPFPHPLPVNVVLTNTSAQSSSTNAKPTSGLHGIRGSKQNSNAAALKEKNDAVRYKNLNFMPS